MRIMMVLASGFSYLISNSMSAARYGNVSRFNFESPLTQLVWFTSILSVVLTYIVSYLIVPDLGGNSDLWWQLSSVITCGTLAGAIIPEMVKVFTSTESRHVREVVSASREGGASLNILSGLVAGNFSSYWLGIAIMLLMTIAYAVSSLGLGDIMQAPAIFAFGLVAFGFLGMGPVTIAVDSYGPVTDNAQSVYELSVIEQIPGVQQEIKRDHGFDVNFETAKELLEENDGAGNTFKATAKPVLIGTAVVGATTMIGSGEQPVSRAQRNPADAGRSGALGQPRRPGSPRLRLRGARGRPVRASGLRPDADRHGHRHQLPEDPRRPGRAPDRRNHRPGQAGRRGPAHGVIARRAGVLPARCRQAIAAPTSMGGCPVAR
jgi:hypothetical protein